MRDLVLVLGDQLDLHAAAFDGFDPAQDAVWMAEVAEVAEESTHVWSSAALNELDAHQPLPAWYWTGDTDSACLREALMQTLEHGYAHHIQRLMVTGAYALMLGVDPGQVHGWYLSVYVDAVAWVELPNTLGMSQYADGGLMASKPYASSGRYIERQSPLCQHCRYRPGEATGERACPFTTLYWDFLLRHETRLAANPRMAGPLRQLERLTVETRRQIQARAALLRAS